MTMHWCVIGLQWFQVGECSSVKDKEAEEVREVHWMSLAEIAERADEFTPDSLLAIATWQARRLV